MPTPQEYFTEYSSKDATALHEIRSQILASVNDDYEKLSNDDLIRIWTIDRALRRVAAPQPKVRKRAAKTPVTMEDLA